MRRQPRSKQGRSAAASEVYRGQLDAWSVEKHGEYTAENVETVSALGELVQGIWKHTDDKTLAYTSVDSTSVEQQTELHDGAGPFASEFVGRQFKFFEIGALACGAQGECPSGLG